MQHVVHAIDRPPGDCQVGQVAFDELHAGERHEVSPIAGDEVVGDAHTRAAAEQFFREVGSDEAGAAGDEV